MDFTASPNRVSITYDGHLRISRLVASDQGRYQCVASNMAAVRDSSPINLHILSKYSFWPLFPLRIHGIEV